MESHALGKQQDRRWWDTWHLGMSSRLLDIRKKYSIILFKPFWFGVFLQQTNNPNRSDKKFRKHCKWIRSCSINNYCWVNKWLWIKICTTWLLGFSTKDLNVDFSYKIWTFIWYMAFAIPNFCIWSFFVESNLYIHDMK